MLNIFLSNEEALLQIINEAFMKGVNNSKLGIQLKDGKLTVKGTNDLKLYMEDVLDRLQDDDKAFMFFWSEEQYELITKFLTELF